MLKLTDKNRLSIVKPELCKEWSDKNKSTADQYSFGSDKKVWWKCKDKNCNYEWLSAIKDRSRGNKCPKCSGMILSDSNRLSINKPELIKEWSYKNNSTPDQYSIKSNRKVWWECKNENCKHEWQANIDNRSKGSKCPKCSGKIVSDRNRLSILKPELCKEWSNENELTPDNYCIGNHIKVWWECNKCNHKWKASINNRSRGSGCRNCSGKNISKQSNDWLSYLNIPNDSKHREVSFTINSKKYYVDGYNPSTNTVYEFHGDYWHGNPMKYKPNDINHKSKKSFGKLYENTLSKEQDIINAGFNLITIWESQWVAVDDLFYTN